MRAAILILTMLLAGCAGPPKPLKPGDIVPTPQSCEAMRQRGGNC